MWQKANWQNWRVLIKLDPDKKIEGKILKEITLSPSVDGIIVGGTQNITGKNTEDLISLVKSTGYTGPLIQEISEIRAISLNVDGYLLPVVLNTGDRDWFIGKHLEAVKAFGHLIDWSQILSEAYVICNPECAAAKLTGAIHPSLDDVLAYLTLVEEIYRLPVIYLEYSGMYGDVEWIKAVRRQCRKAHIFYGGGIKNIAQTIEMLEFADTVVLGNLIYEQPYQLLGLLESYAKKKG